MPLLALGQTEAASGKQAVGGEVGDVNNIFLNACPAFRKSGKHVHLHTLAHSPLTVPLPAGGPQPQANDTG